MAQVDKAGGFRVKHGIGIEAAVRDDNARSFDELVGGAQIVL